MVNSCYASEKEKQIIRTKFILGRSVVNFRKLFTKFKISKRHNIMC